MRGNSHGKEISLDVVNYCNGYFSNANKLPRGVRTGQCVALVQSYYEFLGVPRPRGHARQYGSVGSVFQGHHEQNTVPDGWTTIVYRQGFIAQPGDVAVWTDYFSNSHPLGIFGHVGIVISANNRQLIYADQCLGLSNVRRTTIAYTEPNTIFWGVIRPNFNSSSQTPRPTQTPQPQTPLSITRFASDRTTGTRQDTFVFTVTTNVPAHRVEIYFGGVGNGHGQGSLDMRRSSRRSGRRSGRRSSNGTEWTLSINNICAGTQALTATAFSEDGTRSGAHVMVVTVTNASAPRKPN
jgi:hypothetical protein